MKKILPLDAVLIPTQAQLAFNGQIFDVYQWPQEMYDGSTEIFEMLKRPDTVTVIAIVDNKIIVLDDEQPHSGSRKSFPGGRVDEADENVEAAARREVEEETGYSFKNWRLIKVWQPHTKIEWFVHVWMAWDVQDKKEPSYDNGEKITVHELTFKEVNELVIIKSGYLAAATDIFEGLKDLNDLMAFPTYEGQTVDR